MARSGPTLPVVVHEFDGGPADAPLAVWLGDSTAAGVGVGSAADALPSLVAKERAERATVLAVSGDTIEDVLRDQVPRVESLRPAVIYVSVGANDVTHLTKTKQFEQRYRRLVRELPDVPLVLLGVPDMGAPTRLAQPLRAIAGWRGRRLDAAIRAVADDTPRATYVDIAGHTGPPFRRNPDRYFAADRYHPSAEGYALWVEAVIAARI